MWFRTPVALKPYWLFLWKNPVRTNDVRWRKHGVLHAPLRVIAFIVSSSRWRKRERSRLSNGRGPPTTSPKSRNVERRSRVASADPMLSLVNGLPVGPKACAVFSRHRAASGMSAVTTMSSTPRCSTIQSSAASMPLPTTCRVRLFSSGSRIHDPATRVTLRL